MSLSGTGKTVGFITAFLLFGFLITNGMPNVPTFGVQTASVIDPANSTCAQLDNQSGLGDQVSCAFENVGVLTSFITSGESDPWLNAVLIILSILVVAAVYVLFIAPILE